MNIIFITNISSTTLHDKHQLSSKAAGSHIQESVVNPRYRQWSFYYTTPPNSKYKRNVVKCSKFQMNYDQSQGLLYWLKFRLNKNDCLVWGSFKYAVPWQVLVGRLHSRNTSSWVECLLHLQHILKFIPTVSNDFSPTILLHMTEAIKHVY